MKLDTSGNLVWQITYVGTNADSLSSIQQTVEGGFISAGWSDSTDGDLSELTNHGTYDSWVVKLSPDTPLTVQEAKNSEINISQSGY